MSSTGTTSAVRDHWTGTDSWNLVSFCLGMLLENFVYGLASVATGWTHVPATLRSLLLAWAPIWLIIGIAVSGVMADRAGRKITFYVTMTLYGIGAIGLAFSSTYQLILLFLAILLAAGGGEMNTIMAMLQEIMPTRHRSKASYVAFNFINLGGIILGGIAMATVSTSVQRGTLAGAVIVVLIVLFIARNRTPESIRWLHRRGRHGDAEREAEKYFGKELWAARAEEADRREEREESARRSAQGVAPGQQVPTRRLALQFGVAYSMALANAAGFGLITYTLAPTYFPSLTATIIFIAAMSSFTSGFFGLYADHLSRQKLLLIGFSGAVALACLFAALRRQWHDNFVIFVVLLVCFYVFVNVSFISEDTFKSEIWLTERRATLTALVRFCSIGSYIGVVFLIQHLSLEATFYLNIALWCVGLSAAIAWRLLGRETGAGLSVAVSSAE